MPSSAITQNIGDIYSDEAYAKAVAYIQLVGILLFIAIFVFANNIAHMMGDGHFNTNDLAASLSFIFIGMLGVLRGYYQSANTMTVPVFEGHRTSYTSRYYHCYYCYFCRQRLDDI